MREFNVVTGSKIYPVAIGSGLLSQTGHYLRESGFVGRLIVISDSTVKGLYGDKLSKALESDGFEVSTMEMTPGEEQKSLENAGLLYQWLTSLHAERTTPILALGGGVIGDLAGFVAATYRRGVPLLQLPTTLLAQVDSSVGGKVAVDHGQLKNMIGAFYQPDMVITDISTLKSLPDGELENGLAEVIKTAVIRDEQFFSFLEDNMEKIKSLDESVLEEIVYRSVRIKAEVVGEDELDTGSRHILNYGHTVGHAVESASGFKLRHGEAVAIGMIAAGRLACKCGMLAESEMKRLRELITRADLPTEIPPLWIEEIMRVIQHDKKVRNGKTRFVLLESIGNASIVDNVSQGSVKEVLIGNDKA